MSRLTNTHSHISTNYPISRVGLSQAASQNLNKITNTCTGNCVVSQPASTPSTPAPSLNICNNKGDGKNKYIALQIKQKDTHSYLNIYVPMKSTIKDFKKYNLEQANHGMKNQQSKYTEVDFVYHKQSRTLDQSGVYCKVAFEIENETVSEDNFNSFKNYIHSISWNSFATCELNKNNIVITKEIITCDNKTKTLIIINFYPMQFDMHGGKHPGCSSIGFIQQTSHYYSIDLNRLVPDINNPIFRINLKYSKYYMNLYHENMWIPGGGPLQGINWHILNNDDTLQFTTDHPLDDIPCLFKFKSTPSTDNTTWKEQAILMRKSGIDQSDSIGSYGYIYYNALLDKYFNAISSRNAERGRLVCKDSEISMMSTVSKTTTGILTDNIIDRDHIIFTIDSLNTFEDQINYIIKHGHYSISLHVIMALKYALNGFYSQAENLLLTTETSLTGLPLYIDPISDNDKLTSNNQYTALKQNACNENSIVFKNNNTHSAVIQGNKNEYSILSLNKIDKDQGAEAYVGLCDVNTLNTELKDIKQSITFDLAGEWYYNNKDASLDPDSKRSKYLYELQNLDLTKPNRLKVVYNKDLKNLFINNDDTEYATSLENKNIADNLELCVGGKNIKWTVGTPETIPTTTHDNNSQQQSIFPGIFCSNNEDTANCHDYTEPTADDSKCTPITGDCHQSAGLHLIDIHNTELNDNELAMFELPNDNEHSHHNIVQHITPTNTQTTQDVNMSLVNTHKFLIKQEQQETKFLLNKQSALIGLKIDFESPLDIEHMFGYEKQSGITIEISNDKKSILIIGNKHNNIKGEGDFKSILKHNSSNKILSIDNPLVLTSDGVVEEMKQQDVEIVSGLVKLSIPSSLASYDVLFKHDKHETYIYTNIHLHSVELLYKNTIDLHSLVHGKGGKIWSETYNYSKKSMRVFTSNTANYIPLNKWVKLSIQNSDNKLYDVLSINDDEPVSFKLLTEDDHFFFLNN